MMKERIQQALNAQMSGVRTSPAERSELFENAIGGKKVKRKLTVGLVFAMALLLVTVAAVAAILLTHQEIVEQVAVPMAMENDDEISLNESYTTEELAELVRTLNENGITLEENSAIMRALRTGNGYYEEAVIYEICQKAFGGTADTWTLEEQDWYMRMAAEIGFGSYESCLPGEDNMTYEQAEAFAFSILKKEYGEDLAPEDRTAYRLGRSFYRDQSMNGEGCWWFELQPRDLEHGRYSVYFYDSDPEGSVETSADVRDWTKPYTAEELKAAFSQAYGWSQGDWPQAVWQKLHEMMLGLEIDPYIFPSREYRGYQLTEYPEPAEGEITRDEAIRIALDAVKEKQAAMDLAILTEYEGSRAWLVSTFCSDGEKLFDQNVVTIDSTSGKVESVRTWTEFDDNSIKIMPEAAYSRAREEGFLTFLEQFDIAKKTIAGQYPELDLLNEAEYEPDGSAYEWGIEVKFRTRNVSHGNVQANVFRSGTVRLIYADREPADGDRLLGRYRDVYGWFGNWEQKIWAQLAKDMEPLEPKFIEGMLLKMGRFPEESTVRIGHEEAQKLALKATGTREAQINTCVLVDSEPHPVWKCRVLVYDDASDRVIELDAETGEVIANEPYKVDYTPDYALYSTEKNRRALEMQEIGKVKIAEREATYAFCDLNLDYPEPEFNDPSEYDVWVKGLTVHMVSLWNDRKNYEVELDENGYVVRCEVSDSRGRDRQAGEPEESGEEPDDAGEDPEQAEADPEPEQASAADSKPWFWGQEIDDEAYWAGLEKAMGEWGVTAENYEEKAYEWRNRYGDESEWPWDCYLLYDIFRSFDEGLEHYSDEYQMFSVEGKPTREELKGKAKEAFREAVGQQRDRIWIAAVRVNGELWNHMGEDRAPGWIMVMEDYSPDYDCWGAVGFVGMDLDGNVLFVTLELDPI